MNKIYGLTSDFTYVAQDESRTIISYGQTEVDDTHSTWYDVCVYKKVHQNISFNEIKEAIINDINERTDEKILSGFVWNDISVWLSSENQFNFKAAYDLAVQSSGATLPITFKLGEVTDDEGNITPVYYTFEDMTTFTDFFGKSVAYINQCLNEGWAEKDSMDFSPYESVASE